MRVNIRNHEWYYDFTAYYAIKNICRREQLKNQESKTSNYYQIKSKINKNFKNKMGEF